MQLPLRSCYARRRRDGSSGRTAAPTRPAGRGGRSSASAPPADGGLARVDHREGIELARRARCAAPSLASPLAASAAIMRSQLIEHLMRPDVAEPILGVREVAFAAMHHAVPEAAAGRVDVWLIACDSSRKSCSSHMPARQHAAMSRSTSCGVRERRRERRVLQRLRAAAASGRPAPSERQRSTADERLEDRAVVRGWNELMHSRRLRVKSDAASPDGDAHQSARDAVRRQLACARSLDGERSTSLTRPPWPRVRLRSFSPLAAVRLAATWRGDGLRPLAARAGLRAPASSARPCPAPEPSPIRFLAPRAGVGRQDPFADALLDQLERPPWSARTPSRAGRSPSTTRPCSPASRHGGRRRRASSPAPASATASTAWSYHWQAVVVVAMHRMHGADLEVQPAHHVVGVGKLRRESRPAASACLRPARRTSPQFRFAAAMLDLGGMEVGQAELPVDFFAGQFRRRASASVGRRLLGLGDPRACGSIGGLSRPPASSALWATCRRTETSASPAAIICSAMPEARVIHWPTNSSFCCQSPAAIRSATARWAFEQHL